MARYSTSIVSQTAQLAGMPSGTTVNGYLGYWGGSATAGFRLRRVTLGVRTTTATVPTSQQYTVEIHRQTVAPAGTGLAAAVLGQALETWTPADPTLTTAPIKTLTLNTQSAYDYPFEFLEELVSAIGTANGLAFVNVGNTLPPAHLITLDIEIEV
jgi:hypothetical protein